MEPQRQKCIRCKMNMTMDKFKQKRDDSYQKTCVMFVLTCVMYQLKIINASMVGYELYVKSVVVSASVNTTRYEVAVIYAVEQVSVSTAYDEIIVNFALTL